MFGLIPWRRTEPVTSPRNGGPFELMTREFFPEFNRLWGEWPVMLPEANWERYWGMTMQEAENEVVVRFELPGFEVGEVGVELRGNVVSVHAEHKAPEGEEGESRSVRREVTLPEGVNLEAIEASYRNGILEVHVPRLPEAAPHRIEVKG